MKSSIAFALVSFVLVGGCDEPTPEARRSEAATQEAANEDGPPSAGPIPESWVDARVADARERLRSDEAGQLVWQAIEAHGGLQTWLGHGTIEFEFDYQPVGKPEERKHTFNQVDLWRARAYQQEIGDEPPARLGWDGEEAWIYPDSEAFPITARFWATTPYYFVGVPFVFADQGTRFERLPDFEIDGAAHRVVKVTYESGTGDSPDDYYVLYLHPETHRVSALGYIVAYPAFFPEGGHSPEKLMRFEGLHEVQGILVPSALPTHRWEDEEREILEKVTDIEVSMVRFGESYPATLFQPIEGATIEPPLEDAQDEGAD